MKICLRYPFNITSGYKNIILSVIKKFREHNIECIETELCSSKHNNDILELCIFPINVDFCKERSTFCMPIVKNRIFFTMWESTKLPRNIIDLFNSSRGIITPCEWNCKLFSENGVSVNIYKCPLFIDTNVFVYSDIIKKNYFEFVTGNADPRKRINDVCKTFTRAFSFSKKDVKLNVKIHPRDIRKVSKFADSRISVNTQIYSNLELKRWYEHSDVFVSGTSAEGWGLMQLESMGVGRPIICVNYSGVSEFFNDSVGFPVKYNIVPATGMWGGENGMWSKYEEGDMIDKLRWCYNNPSDVYKIGIASNKLASSFTETLFFDNLMSILKQHLV